MITRGFSDSGRGVCAVPLGLGRRLGISSRSGRNIREAIGRREGNGVRDASTKSGRRVGGADGISISGLRVGLALNEGRDVLLSPFSHIGRIAVQILPSGQQSLSGRGVWVISHMGANCPQMRSSGQHSTDGRGSGVDEHIGINLPHTA